MKVEEGREAKYKETLRNKVGRGSAIALYLLLTIQAVLDMHTRGTPIASAAEIRLLGASADCHYCNLHHYYCHYCLKEAAVIAVSVDVMLTWRYLERLNRLRRRGKVESEQEVGRQE
jgi:hypothetical protein